MRTIKKVASHIFIDGFGGMTQGLFATLIIGTMIGVFFFRGVPVGPLIAAGVVYVIMSLWDRLMG